jgi:hypothetical protein
MALVAAVLVAWCVVSVGVAVLLGGVLGLRRRDLALETGRVHALEPADGALLHSGTAS